MKLIKMDNFFRLFNTIKYLKSKQIYFRVFYYTRSHFRSLIDFNYSLTISAHTIQLSLQPSIQSADLIREGEFTFLNLSKRFNNKINWNFSTFGKLWTYNLTYFEYLNQTGLSQDEGLRLINDYIDHSASIKDGFEPFPISLRGINWIKFLTKHQIQDQMIDDSLYAQYLILFDNLEYHLLGNHLLENGFSLLFGAYYFRDEKLYKKAKNILENELEEQILQDGAHFELSPMYHQIMLFRVLDCINLLQNNNWKNQKLLKLLISKSKKMIEWLNTMTYEKGNIPLLNDSANNIAPTSKQLNLYAIRLNSKLNIQNSKLSDSGYRKFKNKYYEMIMDVGNIGPDYIPGHAHSDTFHFELYVGGEPFIVDTGTSTYETNQRRTLERSTHSHNTVMIDRENQSEVWGGFRVARRTKIIQLKENNNIIEATHNGYKRLGVLHTRKFIMQNKSVMIEDHIKSTSEHECIAYLHFHPEVKPEIDGSDIIVNDVLISTTSEKLKIKNYYYAPEFNVLKDAKMVIVSFKNTLKMEIKL